MPIATGLMGSLARSHRETQVRNKKEDSVNSARPLETKATRFGENTNTLHSRLPHSTCDTLKLYKNSNYPRILCCLLPNSY